MAYFHGSSAAIFAESSKSVLDEESPPEEYILA
jgi:hypothetical protein